MKTNSWLTTFEMLVGCIFWGIGYFFGFSLVSFATAGFFYSEEFSVLITGRESARKFWVYVHEGKFFLIAELVAAIGWIFLTSVVWGVLTLAGMV